jgi:pilus assembly protein CpaE
VDTVLVVTTPELPALRATRNFLDLADAAADHSGKWSLVLSSYQGKKVLPISDIETSIRYPVKATIADDIATVAASINRGMPLVTSHRKSPVSQDILALTKQLVDSNPKSALSQSTDKERSTDERMAGHSEQNGKRSSLRHSLANTFRASAG